MTYFVSAMVVYYDAVEADTEEEAMDKFCEECPYDVDGQTIEVEPSEVESEPQESEDKE